MSKTSYKIITSKEDWHKCLLKMDTYDCYHTYEYQHITKSGSQQPKLFFFEQENAMAAIPLLLQPIEGTSYNDVTSVYGYSGPVGRNLDAIDTEIFRDVFISFLKSYSIISVFSRLNPYIAGQERLLSSLGSIVPNGKVVYVDLTQNLKDQRQGYNNRLKNHVNKANRSCYVKRGVGEDDINSFIEIYYENMHRVNATKNYFFSKEYFFSLLNDEKINTELWLAYETSTNTPIAGCLFFITNSIIQYHLSGTKTDYLSYMPNKLLIDHMRIEGTNRGMKLLNLGGGIGGSYEDSLFRFKSSFSKDTKSFKLWKYIANQEVYDDLVVKKGVNTQLANGFFPLYRYNIIVE